MKIRAKKATSYHWRGMRYVWQKDGDVLDLPEPLGFYLHAQRGDFFTKVPDAGDTVVTDTSKTTDGTDVGKAKGTGDGDTENPG